MFNRMSQLFLLFLVFFILGCSGAKNTPAAAPSPTRQPDAQTAPSPQAAHYEEPAGSALHVDAGRAMQYTREIVAIGPRWDGGTGQQKVGAYLHSKLKNDQVEEDAFVAD